MKQPTLFDLPGVGIPEWSRQAADDWLEKWPGSIAPRSMFTALKPLVNKHGWEKVRPRWREFLRQQKAQFVDPFRFAATWTDWQRSIPL